MSTKCTIAYGKNFHFYREVLDDNFVYLRLEGVEFEASYNQVTISIPVHIWEVIRQDEGIDLSWVDKTDEAIREDVEKEVDARIKAYQAAENESQKNMISLLGSLTFGRADEPLEEQIKNGIEQYQLLRKHQQEVRKAIEELQKQNSGT
jgi:hypothetical protein